MTKTTVYYPVGGAIRVNGTLYFVVSTRLRQSTRRLKSKLGSANVVTDASGNTVGQARYYPYGETRLTTGTMNTDQLFTGQREMAGLGIYHYGARFYSPKLGRFLSADSMVPNMANPQALNRYSYVYNNPVRYFDPSGHDPVCGYSYSDPECYAPDLWEAPQQLPPPPPPPPLDSGQTQDRPRRDGGSPEPEPIVGVPVVPVVPPGDCSGSNCPIVSVNITNPPDFSINWSEAAVFTQDLATSIDLVFAGIEAGLIVVGCSAGRPEGCAAGWAAGMMLFNVSGANAAESYLSGMSLAFTIADDFNTTGGFGEASFTSAVTFLIGGINPDPIADLVIDGYASGYNHGIFNDLNTIFFGGPIIEP